MLNFLILLANGVILTLLSVDSVTKLRLSGASKTTQLCQNSVSAFGWKCHVAYNVVSGPFSPWNTWVLATFP